MSDRAKAILRDSVAVQQSMLDDDKLASALSRVASLMADALKRGKKILCFGNGGSAADSQHLVAELVGRFQMERSPLPAIALTTDTSILTALANDFGFDNVFERQIAAHGRSGDIAIGITTSGRSVNVINAFTAAQDQGLVTVGLTGQTGATHLADFCTEIIVAPSDETQRVQECHGVFLHVLCELFEDQLIPPPVDSSVS